MSADLTLILPEIVLALFAMGSLVAAVYTVKDELAGPLLWATAGLMGLLAVWIGTSGPDTQTGFNGMFQDDPFSHYAKVIILLASAIVLIMSRSYLEKRKLLRFEFPALIALSVVGMMMMVSAGDLILLYMGLELQSLALYVVASMRRDSVRSTEAGLKYFVLGALSSGLLLYGASLVYGFSGTTQFAGIYAAAEHGHVSVGLLIGLVLMIAGMGFKVSAVPFHMWTPDVYEGAPTPVTAFFATAPKVAALGLFARVMHDAFGNAVADWSQVIALISVLSMFLGAFAAIGQTDIKRLMAYSSIAHMGYALVGLAAGNVAGVKAMLIYMALYVIMNVGTFAFILTMERDGRPVSDIRNLGMYSAREPAKALALLALLFSLAGIPPFIGFWGKWAVLVAAVDANMIWLAVMAVIASVIGAYYYLRITYYMFFGDAPDEPMDDVRNPVLYGLVILCGIAVLVGIGNLFGIEGPAGFAAAALVN